MTLLWDMKGQSYSVKKWSTVQYQHLLFHMNTMNGWRKIIPASLHRTGWALQGLLLSDCCQLCVKLAQFVCMYTSDNILCQSAIRPPSFRSRRRSWVFSSLPCFCPFYRSIPTWNEVFFRNFFPLVICESSSVAKQRAFPINTILKMYKME